MSLMMLAIFQGGSHFLSKTLMARRLLPSMWMLFMSASIVSKRLCWRELTTVRICRPMIVRGCRRKLEQDGR